MYTDSSGSQVAQSASPAMPSEKSSAGITGHLGTLDLILTTLAFAGPLAGTTGYITVMIAFGNGIGTPLTFLAVMVVLLMFSVGYGAMTRYVPKAGAFYAYITAGLGRPAGLGSSFLILASYYSIGVGFYAFAGLTTRHFVVSHGGPDLPWWAFSLVFWAAVATLAYFHVAISAKVLGVLLIAEVLVVLVFDAVIMIAGGEEGVSMRPFSIDEFSSGSIGIAFIFAIALFSGFEGTAIYREETRDPDRTIPRATMLVVLFIGLFYALTSWAMITALGTSQAVTRSNEEGAAAFDIVATKFVGSIFVDITSLLLLTSIFAAHLAIQNVSTRYMYSLAVDGILPRYLGRAHPRHKSPARASVTVSAVFLVLTAVLVAAGLTDIEIYTWFAGVASFTIICAMTITSLSAVVYFRKNNHTAVSTWQGTIAPLIAFGSLLVMVYLGIENFPTLIGGSQMLANIMLAVSVAIFVFGVVLAIILRRTKPDVYMRIGRQ